MKRRFQAAPQTKTWLSNQKTYGKDATLGLLGCNMSEKQDGSWLQQVVCSPSPAFSNLDQAQRLAQQPAKTEGQAKPASAMAFSRQWSARVTGRT